MPSQKERVLQTIKSAGPKGVRSDVFLRMHIPRAAARVQELKAEGWEISSKRVKQFVVYRLVGVGVGIGQPQGPTGSEIPPPVGANVDSSDPIPLFEEPKRPKMFDLDAA